MDALGVVVTQWIPAPRPNCPNLRITSCLLVNREPPIRVTESLKPPLNCVQTPLFLPTPLKRNTCAEKMPTKVDDVISHRAQAEGESACHEDWANLLVPPIDDGFGAAIDNFEICRHRE